MFRTFGGNMRKYPHRTKLVAVLVGTCVVTAAAMLLVTAEGDDWDRVLTYSERTAIPVGGGRIEVAYESVDKASSNIPKYGDRTYTPHVSVTAYNDSAEAKTYTIRFDVSRSGAPVHASSNVVTMSGVQPDSRSHAQYEITQKERRGEPGEAAEDGLPSEQETYVDSPTGKDFTLEIREVKSEKHYTESGSTR
ncbi:hypothetical protein AB0E78_33515 [Streptomyces sp. NPDC032198]|uniref:hypothetical protein n=1 Tax=Streptomyces sp. NPDC032198 TaxID=3155127 RepID=UPI00340C8F0F